MPQKLLVTGANGHLGRRVIAHLLEMHKISPANIVATSRDPGKLDALAKQGVQVRQADFENPATLDNAFKGVDRALIISTDAIDRPGRRLAQHKAAVEAAKRAGVKHVLYTSMPKPDVSLVLFAPDHLGTEQAIAASGLGYTILRNNWYMENLLMTVPTLLATGKWFTAAGEGRIPYISREDCARAAAAAMASESSDNKRYDITGPESFTVAQIAALISEFAGKQIEVVQLNDEQLAAGLKAAGLPEPVAQLLVSMDANTRAGNKDIQSNAVVELTGKKPQTLREFLGANKAAFQA